MSFFSTPTADLPDYFAQLPSELDRMVTMALDEDINHKYGGTDITADLIPEDTIVSARLISRESGVLSGADWFSRCFHKLDASIQLTWQIKDGDAFAADDVLCRIEGNARAILAAERSAMNFLQTLSGTATVTADYLAKIDHTACKLLDTRKTIPGFRLAQKYAVLCGGGLNHRIGLFDAYLIKENHIRACGGIRQAVDRAKQLHPDKHIEIEVESLDELQQAISAGVDIVMLDNFSNSSKREAVAMNNGTVKLEASGDITLNSIAVVAETGVDYISVGAITKHVQAIDFSLLVDAH